MDQQSTVSVNAPPMPNQAAVSLSPGSAGSQNSGVTSHVFRPTPNSNPNPNSPSKNPVSSPSITTSKPPPMVNSSPVKPSTPATVAAPKSTSVSKPNNTTAPGDTQSSVSPSQSSCINHVGVLPKVDPVNLPLQPKPDPSSTPAPPNEPVPEVKALSLTHGKEDGKKTVSPNSDGQKSKIATPPASTNNSATISPVKTSPSTVKPANESGLPAKQPIIGLPKQTSPLNHTDAKSDSRSAALSKPNAVSPGNASASLNETTPTLTKKQTVVKNERKRVQVEQNGDRKVKRARIPTQHYQSPIPELTYIPRALKITPAKPVEDKMIVFFKGEHLAVRNADGSFYICQAVQNIHKNSHKIKIRWLSRVDGTDNVYSPDFYDHTEFECILTNLSMKRLDKEKYSLPEEELQRTNNILKRALAFEKGEEKEEISEEHPDGIDVSILKDESQLKRSKPRKRSPAYSPREPKPRSQPRKKRRKFKVDKSKHKESGRAQAKPEVSAENKKSTQSEDSTKPPIKPLKISRRAADAKLDDKKKRKVEVPLKKLDVKKTETKPIPVSRSLRGNKEAARPQEIIPSPGNFEGRRKRMGLKQAAVGRKKGTKRA